MLIIARFIQKKKIKQKSEFRELQSFEILKSFFS